MKDESSHLVSLSKRGDY